MPALFSSENTANPQHGPLLYRGGEFMFCTTRSAVKGFAGCTQVLDQKVKYLEALLLGEGLLGQLVERTGTLTSISEERAPWYRH